ncbi:MAG TPA: glycosyltransferase family 39 protein [Blastocatellia bacterium]|nr:glycosyltransferase family 39 protein [Blastocatellia bacterium]
MPPNLRRVLLLAFLLRSILFGAAYFSLRDPQAFYAKDTWSYLQPAIEWITQGSFTMHGEPELFRTPGYAALLGFGIKLGHIEFITIALQILLSCVTTYLLFRIAKDLFDDTCAAVWSALLYSLEPLSIIACSWLLSETLFATLLAAALFFLITFARQHKTSSIILSAVFFAAAAYVRPIGYFLPLVLTLVLLLWSVVQRKGRLVKPALLFCIVSLALMGLWQVRNYRQSGYGGFSVAMAYNLYFHQVAALRANAEQRPFYEVLDEMGFYDRARYLQAHPEQQSWPLADRYEFMRREGIAAVWRAPLTAGKIYLRGLAIALFDPGAAEYLRLFQAYPRSGRLMDTLVREGIVSLLQHIITAQPLLFVLSAMFGLWLLVNYALALLGLKGQPLTLPLLLLLATGLYQLALSGGTLASGRFRMPVMIVVCILAGQGLSKALARLPQVKR